MTRAAAPPVSTTGRRCAGRRRVVAIVAMVAAVATVATACDSFHAPFLERIDGPVVVTGADLPQAVGADPETAVGFRWDDQAGSWVQIPIQIDQRHVVDFGTRPPTNATPGGPTYGRAAGPDPESSTVVGRSYSLAFSDRWIHDELRITDASGADILDGHKSRFDLDTCGRSNATLAAAEGPSWPPSTDPSGGSVRTWAPTAARSPNGPSTSMATATRSSPTCASTPSPR
jgi:hypothetical protein